MVLFFSRGISLDIWRDSGLLSREMSLYRRLSPHLDSIVFMTYGGKEDRAFIGKLNGVEVLHNRWNLPTDLFGLFAPFLYRSRMRSADIFKTNQINGWWVAGLAKFLYRKPLVVRCGYLLSLDQRRKGYRRLRVLLVSLLEKWAFEFADGAIVPTAEIKKEVTEGYGVSEEKISVIPSAVDTDLFRSMPEIGKTKGRLGFVGRFSPEKNLMLLLDSVAGIGKASLLLVGDGEMRPELERRALELRVDVIFRGHVSNDQLPKVLNTCEAFVLPSRWEGLPKALLEAMACGLAVIGTDVPGIRDIIEHGKTGLICDSSVTGLRSAIFTVLNDASLRKRLGEHAREFVEKHFSLEQAVAQELNLLHLLGKR